MRIIRNMAVALSLYSRIPMPSFEWKEEDMKHTIAFLPLVGVVISALTYAVYILGSGALISDGVRMILLMLVPLIVTGGFHVDGYMDVEDALKSYKKPEEKLEILKDPHIGAFAVIRLLILVLIWGGLLLQMVSYGESVLVLQYAMAYPVVRSLCGLTSLKLKHAKKDGMLNMETGAGNTLSYIILFAWLLPAVIGMLYLGVVTGVSSIACLAVFTIVYRCRCYKEFGGVTGDTAGYFVCVGEVAMLFGLVMSRLLLDCIN